MLIAVNATAISPGGGLTILNQFLNSASLTEHNYVCFVPHDANLSNYNNVKFIRVQVKSWIKRIWWDSYGLKRFLEKNSIVVDKLVSLQNTTVNVNVQQIIYLHQPIPFVTKEIIRKCKSIKLYAYYYFYKIFIFMFSRSNTIFVVQTEWMQRSLLKCNVASSQVFVLKPNIFLPEVFCGELSNNAFVNSAGGNLDLTPKLIYPASTVPYKNHFIVLEAIKILRDMYPDLVFSFQVTFSKGEYFEFDNFVNANYLSNYIDYLGFLSADEIYLRYIHSHALLFPSYIESYGLPLVESALLGKKILASDLPYARDVIKNYEGVDFIGFDDVESWVNAILAIVTNPKCHFPVLTYENELVWADFFKLFKK